jgi:16S rRNA (cytosine967-C5)-methyltransferase
MPSTANPGQGADRRQNSRAVAAGVLDRWLQTGLFPDRLIVTGTEDRAFVVEVVYGCAKQRRLLEWIVGRCSDRDADAPLLPYLLVGAYQILLMDHVADFAAVNETVAAAKSNPRVRHACGFINGVLRQAVRERDRIRQEMAALPEALRLSHPDGLFQRWSAGFGKARAIALCDWNNGRANAVVHPLRGRAGAEEFRARLHDAGVEATPHPFAADEFLILPHGVRVAALPGYAEGLFTVQDASTMAAIRLLDPSPGQCVLDACASPGGKTLLIAERMGGQGDLLAVDLYEDRLQPMRDNLLRTGMESVRVADANAAVPAELERVAGSMRFDRILVDAPCTNTGVLRRRPDARWRFSDERLGQLRKMQRAILDSVVRFLKPGGRVVYSTCSLEPEENEQLVGEWLAGHRDFSAGASSFLFPPDTQTDGAFAAALERAG